MIRPHRRPAQSVTATGRFNSHRADRCNNVRWISFSYDLTSCPSASYTTRPHRPRPHQWLPGGRRRERLYVRQHVEVAVDLVHQVEVAQPVHDRVAAVHAYPGPAQRRVVGLGPGPAAAQHARPPLPVVEADRRRVHAEQPATPVEVVEQGGAGLGGQFEAPLVTQVGEAVEVHLPAQRVDGDELDLRRLAQRARDVLGDLGFDPHPGEHVGECRRCGLEVMEQASRKDQISRHAPTSSCLSRHFYPLTVTSPGAVPS